MSAPLKTDVELDLDKIEEAGARTHALEFPRTWLSDILERAWVHSPG